MSTLICDLPLTSLSLSGGGWVAPMINDLTWFTSWPGLSSGLAINCLDGAPIVSTRQDSAPLICEAVGWMMTGMEEI